MQSSHWTRFLWPVLLAIGVVAGTWPANAARRNYQQRQRVSEIWHLGGYVHRSHEMPQQAAFLPAWQSILLGDDFLDPVVVVSLATTEAGDANLARIAGLNKVIRARPP